MLHIVHPNIDPAGMLQRAFELPGWRSHLDQQVMDDPLFRAAFKIAGAV
jgi:hypothetical protein